MRQEERNHIDFDGGGGIKEVGAGLEVQGREMRAVPLRSRGDE